MSPPRSRRTPLDPETLRPRGRHQRAIRRKRRRKGAVDRRGRDRRACRCGRSRRWGCGPRLRVVLRPRFASLGPYRREHVRVRSQRLPPRLDPRGAQPRAGDRGGHVALDSQGDDRDRGQAVLRSRRSRHRRHRTRGRRRRTRRRDRRGRLDHHAAARPQPLHLPRADGAAEGEGGVPRDEARSRVDQAADPHHVPEPGLLRQPRVRHRGCRADVLLEAREEAHPLARPRCSPV